MFIETESDGKESTHFRASLWGQASANLVVLWFYVFEAGCCWDFEDLIGCFRVVPAYARLYVGGVQTVLDLSVHCGVLWLVMSKDEWRDWTRRGENVETSVVMRHGLNFNRTSHVDSFSLRNRSQGAGSSGREALHRWTSSARDRANSAHCNFYLVLLIVRLACLVRNMMEDTKMMVYERQNLITLIAPGVELFELLPLSPLCALTTC